MEVIDEKIVGMEDIDNRNYKERKEGDIEDKYWLNNYRYFFFVLK